MADKRIKGLTVEIGGDLSKLNTALKEAETSTKNATSELRQVNNALKDAPESAELWRQKQELLNNALQASKDKLNLLTQSQKSLSQQLADGDIDKDQYDKFQEKLEKSRDKLDKLKSQQSEFENKFKSGEIDKEQYEKFCRKVTNAEDAVKELESAEKSMEERVQCGEISEEQYRAFQREVVTTQNKIESFENELKSLDNVADDASDEVDELGDETEEAGEKADNSSGGFTVLKGALANLVSEGINKAIDSMKEFAEQALTFEESIAKVSTIADTSAVSMEELEEQIIELSNETGVSADDIADSVYNAISAGQDTADAVNFVSEATKLARAGFTETSDALDILSTVMNAYGLEADEVTRVSDVLIETQNLGKTTVAELASSMGKIIPTANAYGVSLEQVAAGYSIMTANGVATAESTTYMNSMLNELGKSGTTVSDILKEKTGQSFKELSESGVSLSDTLAIIAEAANEQNLSFSDMWSSAEAGKAGLILLNDNADIFNEALAKMEDSEGTADAAFENLNTTAYELQTFTNELKNDATEIGTELVDAIKPVAEKYLPKVKTAVESLVKSVPTIIDKAEKYLPQIFDTLKDMLPLITGIGAGIATWKTINTLSTGVTAVKSFASSLTSAASGAGLLSGGIVGVVGAIAVGAGSLIYAAEKAKEAKLQKIFDDATAASNELADAVQEDVTAINDLKTAGTEQAASELAELSTKEKLWEQLQLIVDANGKVKSGYEEQATYITGALADAYGVNISMIDGQIEDYQALATEIDNVIAKQRAQVMRDAYSETYQTAVEQNANMAAEYAAVQAEYAENQAYVDQVQQEIFEILAGIYGSEEVAAEEMAKIGDLSSETLEAYRSFAYGDYLFGGEEGTALIKAALENLETNKATMEELQESYKNNKYIIETYEQGEVEFYNGAYEAAEQYYSGIDDLDNATLRNAEKSTEERLSALKTAVDTAIAEYNAAVELGDENAESEFASTMESLIESAKQGGLTMGELEKSGIIDALEGIDGFDTTKLISAAAAAGDSTGQTLGGNAASWVQSYIDGISFSGLTSKASSALSGIGSAVSSFAATYGGSASTPAFASGGTLHYGEGIVAEAGPELIQVMQGGVQVTPLSASARNHVLDGGGSNSKVYYNNYTINVDKVASSYDVTKISQQLAAEQQRIERGKGR